MKLITKAPNIETAKLGFIFRLAEAEFPVNWRIKLNPKNEKDLSLNILYIEITMTISG
ncbi:hypothetical protein [Clostridium folliculivorans]|uniref:hypothetical protein n=1 Tax=Clostridium folliculivorans TaxID=2886038 RepID=UPI0021C38731|nr:hypothetical protein [Clostridium folliculivorans]